MVIIQYFFILVREISLYRKKLTDMITKNLLLSVFLGSLLIGCSEKKTEAKQETENLAPCNIEVGNVKFSYAKNGAVNGVSVLNDTLKFVAGAKTDYFHSPDGNFTDSSPVLFAEIDNTKPFTFTAKVEPKFTSTGTYSAGVIYVYENADLCQKLCFEQDEFGDHRVVTVRTIGTSDDNNHQVIKGPFVYLRYSSDGKQIGSFFSEDGKTWRMARLYKNAYPPKILLGISSQSPKDNEHTCFFSEIEIENKAVVDFRNGKLENE